METPQWFVFFAQNRRIGAVKTTRAEILAMGWHVSIQGRVVIFLRRP